jgi:hypothetical protein
VKNEFGQQTMGRGHGSRQPVRVFEAGYEQDGSALTFVSEGVANQVDWREAVVAYMIVKTEPPLGGGSTFLANREVLMYLASDMYFHIGLCQHVEVVLVTS